MTDKQKPTRKAKRDPQEALRDKMKLVSVKIQKLLEDNDLALYPFTQYHENGGQTPQVRLISTKIENNAKPAGNTEKAERGEESDGATPAE